MRCESLRYPKRAEDQPNIRCTLVVGHGGLHQNGSSEAAPTWK